MAKVTRRDVKIALVSAVIAGIALGIVEGFELMDSWSNDLTFFIASILVIAGGIIIRKFTGTVHEHSFRYLVIGNILLGVGAILLLAPLWERIFSNR